MAQNGAPAPAQGQDDAFPSPSQVLVVNNGTATVINVSQANQTHLDVRIRDRYVRYVNDPATGIWRTAGDGVHGRVSPFALRRITVGRHGIEVVATRPQTGEELFYEGSIDQVASDLHRAGQRRGDRQALFWALTDICSEIKRQQAARGVEA